MPRLAYNVAVPDPEAHLAEVEITIDGASDLPSSLDLQMAAWCPGSYLVRDYARYVRDVEARAGDGTPVPVEKIDKQTWRVERGDRSSVRVRYRVYGHALTVRTNHIDPTHAFLHGPATYLWIEALRDEPCSVRVEPPAGRGWRIATGLAPQGDGFVAANLDELLDAPIHLGEVEEHELVACGVAARLVVWGAPDRGEHGLDELPGDLVAIMEAHAARFGGEVPYDRYTFVLMLSPDAYGGLEHRSSSANLSSPFAFATAKSYQDLLELLSHEFFHVWNGKRIFPQSFERFDYSREVYTRCLWVMEGLTSYFDRYTVRVAGKMPVSRYLEKTLEEWGWLTAIPGRSRHSLERASFDAWIKLYKPDESNVNTTVSYYLKGGLVALALDLEIRRRSRRERSLADVLRLLWERFGRTGRGYPEDVESIFSEAVGFSLADFFSRYVRGTEEPDLGACLGEAGLRLEPGWDRRQMDEARTPPWLGLVLGRGGSRISAVLDGSPAHAAGLSPGDEIVALDRYRCDGEAALRRRISARDTGTRTELWFFRRGQLASATVELAGSPPTRYEIHAVAAPSAEQRALYEDWLGEPFPDEGLVSAATIGRWT